MRHIDIELASICALLHDISQYSENAARKEHANKSSNYAKKLLMSHLSLQMKKYSKYAIAFLYTAINKIIMMEHFVNC